MKNRRSIGMKNFATTGIYALTAEALSRGRTNLEVVDAMIRGGVRFLQYREKEKSSRAMYEECLMLREKTCAAGVTFIVNDAVDVALAVGADGVHIGQDDLPPAVVRALIGEDMILGLSTHNPGQAREAQALGIVDYIGVGPVYATATKKDVTAPVGLSYVRFVAEEITLPFVAIGGIKTHSISEVVKAGAQTIAVVSDLVGADDVEARTRELRALVVKKTEI